MESLMENLQLGEDKWLVATYKPVSLFSLRMTHATSSGGKTLFVPTPYSFKLALVDASFRLAGKTLAREIFNCVKGCDIRFKPPADLVVNHTFIKIKREPKKPTPDNPYISSIAFRDFCFYRGDLKVGLKIGDLTSVQVNKIVEVMAHINYIGKRGSFIQFYGVAAYPEIPKGFTIPVPDALEMLDINTYKVAQFLDDIGAIDTNNLWERINSYSSEKVELNKHRILKQHFIPYREEKTSKGYSYYRNLN